MEVFKVGDEYRQYQDRDCGERDRKVESECCDRDDSCGAGWNIGEWLPILLIIFLLCGGTNWLGGLTGGFGGGGCRRDDCCDDGGGGISWILILLVLFWLFNQKDDNCGGGLFGGLF